MASPIDDDEDTIFADMGTLIGYDKDTIIIDAKAVIDGQDTIMVDKDFDMDILTDGICHNINALDPDAVMAIMD
ncbi:hypothetical protein FRB94_000924 [Tulasnella sp. JGI-2019a]|nr:hypothetical protein FRB94_000924 [Tulasnella sp. JGI-2019a]